MATVLFKPTGLRGLVNPALCALRGAAVSSQAPLSTNPLSRWMLALPRRPMVLPRPGRRLAHQETPRPASENSTHGVVSFSMCRQTLTSTLRATTSTTGAAASSVIKAAGRNPSDYVANQTTLTFAHKFVLVATLKYWPHKLPQTVSLGVLNQAYGRFRIIAATLTIFLMLKIANMAMVLGRQARDGGDECLYDTKTARELQQAKRQWKREFLEREEARLAAEKAAQPSA
ncbi:uncharacterized protein MONBRDRAFT_28118 [Monosiga brevicollis MX1]|uniref:Uncharacterized protein n=1 Tax=Monosiga brevicollis TaxID=81824 RepID=A9V789_MONBE|nr:uncharacterized protein MONBRDRAFT_28118 [Monosiga brevicollis MX1]EDQ86472.1 predicted protein [Monosiga brevicollis MX1]|eukprot:XP_001748585.1 hypothetical protein [Monosiga brevicollis MX1]